MAKDSPERESGKNRSEALRAIELKKELLENNALDYETFKSLHLLINGCRVTEEKKTTEGYDGYGDPAMFVAITLRCDTHQVTSFPSLPSLIP